MEVFSSIYSLLAQHTVHTTLSSKPHAGIQDTAHGSINLGEGNKGQHKQIGERDNTYFPRFYIWQ